MRFRWNIGLLALVLAPSLAAGGNISISISPTVELKDGSVAAQVQVTNSGNEAAHAVAALLRFREQEARGAARETLAPNQSMRAELSIPATELGPGRWPYQVAVDYADANQYPFQALHVGSLLVGSPPPAKIAVAEATAEPLAGSGTLRVRVKNLAGAARKASIGVIVPEGVEVVEPTRSVALDPWQEASVSLKLVNRTALPGSRYPIFIAVEYDDEGMHQAAVGQAMLEITNERSFFQSQRPLLWLGAGVLIVVWLSFLAWQLATGRSRRATPSR